MEIRKVLVFVQFVAAICLGKVSAQGQSCESLSFRTGVDIECQHPSTKESLDCQKMRMPPGTIAKYKCEDFFVTNDGDTGGQMVCSKNGKWTPDLRFRSFSCHMDCGKSYPDSAHTFWPWHVGIFARESHSAPENFKFACGGTLINPFNADELLVLTGAECVRNRNPEDIEIRLGLFSHEKNSRHKSNGQTSPVRRIVTEDDGLLALIQLSRETVLSKMVLPACLSLSVDFAKHQLQESTFGQLVGFGQKSTNDALRNMSAGVVTLGNCIDKRARIISKHSFCAGTSEGKNICDGDFGSGLLFPRFSANSERHFILGVLGEGLRTCRKHSWFIGVSDYADWIKQTALELHEERQRHQQSVQPNPNLFQETAQTERPLTPQAPVEQIQIRSPAISKIQTPRPTLPQSSQRLQTSVPETVSADHELNPDDFASLPIAIQDIIHSLIRTQDPDVIALVEPDQPDVNSALDNSMKDYEITAVLQHNLFRRRHRAPPVKISHQLSQLAQAEAEQALATNRFKFSGFTNWYGLSGNTVPATRLIQDAVRDWYKTAGNYNFASPRANPFTQIVWQRTTAIGVGVAQRGKKQLAVVKYDRPPVNSSERQKSFAENVFPPITGGNAHET